MWGIAARLVLPLLITGVAVAIEGCAVSRRTRTENDLVPEDFGATEWLNDAEPLLSPLDYLINDENRIRGTGTAYIAPDNLENQERAKESARNSAINRIYTGSAEYWFENNEEARNCPVSEIIVSGQLNSNSSTVRIYNGRYSGGSCEFTGTAAFSRNGRIGIRGITPNCEVYQGSISTNRGRRDFYIAECTAELSAAQFICNPCALPEDDESPLGVRRLQL